MSIGMFTDPKELFDMITRARRPTKRRLEIDVIAAREAHQSFKIDRTGLVHGKHTLRKVLEE